LTVCVVLLIPAVSSLYASVVPRPLRLVRTNRRLHGQLVDHTRNHGEDRRIWSEALQQKRDLYVYLPPGYDPCRRYPLVVYLHGFLQDEGSFLESAVIPIDRAIAAGKLPPVIVAAPDGSPRGVRCVLSAGTFFLNSKLGAFEDFLMVDVWNFMMTHYPIRPEREAHVMMGVSMGGGAAFNKAIKYSERFGVVVGIFPPVNLRWLDCHGRYMGNFDPCCWGWRTDFSRGHEVVGRFYGVVVIPLGRFVYPLYGRRNPNTLALVISENPIEMLDIYHIQPGQLEMYIAYAAHDQFNLDAQAESFLYHAHERGLEVGVGYDPRGKHDEATALRLLPDIFEWLRVRLEPYSPH
jgi:S-formylglutathione hydrolase FrmB